MYNIGMHCPSCGYDDKIDLMLRSDDDKRIEWFFWCDNCESSGIIQLDKNASLV